MPGSERTDVSSAQEARTRAKLSTEARELWADTEAVYRSPAARARIWAKRPDLREAHARAEEDLPREGERGPSPARRNPGRSTHPGRPAKGTRSGKRGTART